ncbi:MAG: hypothetical protein R2939_17935 [Kofleriaceae bacterium]
MLAASCSTPDTLVDPSGIAEQTRYVASCGAATALTCDGTARNQCTTTQDAFAAGDYACLAASIELDGSEWIQPLDTTGTGDLVVTTGGASDYAFVAVLRDTGAGPQPAQCITGNWYSVRLRAGIDFTPGESLYVVVDHPEGADMAFDVQADCDAGATESPATCSDGFDGDADYLYDCTDPDCEGTPGCPECAPRAELQCGDTLVPGNTGGFGSTQTVGAYACMPTVDPGGREYAYVFHAPRTETVVFDVSNSADYPILAVIRDDGQGCMTGDCIAGSYYSTRFEAVAGETYYLIVDGHTGSSFSYSASLLCGAPSTETNCANDVDDDGDWAEDCDDPDCAAAPECQTQVCEAVADLTCETRRLPGNTSDAGAQANISKYSCMESLDLGHPEVAYKFKYTTGPATQPVLLTLSNETSYATVAALNDVSVMDLSLTITNTTSSPWSAGLLSTRQLITPGARAPRPGQAGYYAYQFAVDGCDSNCGPGCSDDGNPTVLAAREGLTIGTDAWLVPALAPGQAASVPLIVPSSAKLSYIARVSSTSDDFVAMHVVGDPRTLAVPLADASGAGLDTIAFAISGYDANSRSSTNGNGTSCSSTCPPPSSNCYVAYNNGTTGGAQTGQTGAQELQCNPNQCIAGNYYGTTFTAARGVEYYVTVEGANQPGVGYELSVVCSPPATETDCGDQVDQDGDDLIDCYDPDCAAECDAGGSCAASAAITCGTTRLVASTSDAAATDAVDGYLCAPGVATTGAEVTFEFTAERTEWVNFTTGAATDYAVVAVLEDKGACDPYDCVGTQYYSSVVQVVAGRRYFVVVDGVAGPVDFELSVVCDPPATETSCDDGIDEDGDWLTDCADPDCGC